MIVFDSSVLDKLKKSYDAFDSANNIFVPNKPSCPTKSTYMPRISSKYTRMGELIGICPYELEAILNSEYTEDQVLIINTIKKLVATVKLSDGANLSEVRKTIDTSQNNYSKAIDQFHRHTSDFVAVTANKQNEIDRTTQEFYAEWHSAVDTLEKFVTDNQILSQITTRDRWFIEALSDFPGCVKINRKSIKFNATRCKELKIEDIMSLEANAAKIEKHYAFNEISSVIFKMNIRQLYAAEHRISHPLVSDDDIFDMIERRRRNLQEEQAWKEGRRNFDSYSDDWSSSKRHRYISAVRELIKNDPSSWDD